VHGVTSHKLRVRLETFSRSISARSGIPGFLAPAGHCGSVLIVVFLTWLWALPGAALSAKQHGPPSKKQTAQKLVTEPWMMRVPGETPKKRPDAFSSPNKVSPRGASPVTSSDSVVSRQNLERLLSTARLLGERSDVPYVWGGSRLGSKSECKSCRSCIEQGRVAAKDRKKTCPSCLRCGVDCSHFLAHVFARADVPWPWAPTSVLIKASSDVLRRKFNLNVVHGGLADARPGDIILQEGHMSLLVAKRGRKRWDWLHVNRSWIDGDSSAAGGIVLVRNSPIRGGPVVRVLRHVKIQDPSLPNPGASRDVHIVDKKGNKGAARMRL
jgi:hypothetical protein